MTITLTLEPTKTTIEVSTGDKSSFGPTDYENIGHYVAGRVRHLREIEVELIDADLGGDE